MVGMEVVGEVARKLEMELQVLEGKVVEMAAVGIRGPTGLGGRGSGQGQGQGGQVNGYQQGKSGQEMQGTGQGVGSRGIRAVSLPPILPDHNALEESPAVPEPMQIEKPKLIEEHRRTDRELGSGLPQYQPYWYPSPKPHLTSFPTFSTCPTNILRFPFSLNLLLSFYLL